MNWEEKKYFTDSSAHVESHDLRLLGRIVYPHNQ